MLKPPNPPGETIIQTFTPNVELTGDPHTDADNTERAKSQAVVFTFTTCVLQGAAWEALVRAHSPDDPTDDVNPDTFPQALITACVTGWTVSEAGAVVEDEPRPPTLKEAQELWDEWPQYARRRLYLILRDQNTMGPALGKARSMLNGSTGD